MVKLTKLTGGQIVAEYLLLEGVPLVAGIPGHGCLALVDAFRDRREQLRVIQVRQEMAAVHLADGYYRVTGQPLAVFTSIGPGAINTAIGAATCYVDSTACLILTGETHTYMFGKGVLQEIGRAHPANFPRVLEPVVKRWWQVTDVRQLPAVLRQAFRAMRAGRPGPVLIDLPMDVQAEAAEVVLLPDRDPRPPAAGDSGEIERAATLLAKAARPVILAGGGVNLSQAWGELRQLAELSGAAVVTTLPGKGCFPEDHPRAGWLAGSKGTTLGNALTRQADVLLAVGCRFADETTSSYRKGISFAIPPTRLIHVDIEAAEIGKNYPAEVGIVGDLRPVLSQLEQALGGHKQPDRSAFHAQIEALRQEWLASLAEFRDSDRVPVTISRALREIRAVLPREAIVASSSGNTQAQILQEFPFYLPRTNLTTGGFSTMGWSLPAALGAKLARPETPVVGIVGDGDFLMTIQELATAVQHEIPVVIVVMNNRSWKSIADLQQAVYGEERIYACDFARGDGKLVTPDFVRVAEGFGCWAKRVERPEEVGPALQQALAQGRPAVLEITVNRDFPYSGGRAVGWWDVPVPTYLGERRRSYEQERSEEQLY